MDIYEAGKEALAWVQHHIDPHAVIAGGWAREQLLPNRDMPTKDIDIWAHTELTPAQVVEQVSKRAFAEGTRVRYQITLVSQDGSPTATWAKAVLKLTWATHKVDLILFTQPVGIHGVNVLDQFDFGICQASYDGERLYGTKAFYTDADAGTLTFQDGARLREDLDRVISDHLPRLQAKFPFHKPVGVPEVIPAPCATGGGSGMKAFMYPEVIEDLGLL